MSVINIDGGDLLADPEGTRWFVSLHGETGTYDLTSESGEHRLVTGVKDEFSYGWEKLTVVPARPDIDAECPNLPEGLTMWERQEAKRLWHNAVGSWRSLAKTAAANAAQQKKGEMPWTSAPGQDLMNAVGNAEALRAHLDGIQHRLSTEKWKALPELVAALNEIEGAYRNDPANEGVYATACRALRAYEAGVRRVSDR